MAIEISANAGQRQTFLMGAGAEHCAGAAAFMANSGPGASNLPRYDMAISKSYFQTLRELERLQTLRREAARDTDAAPEEIVLKMRRSQIAKGTQQSPFRCNTYREKVQERRGIPNVPN